MTVEDVTVEVTPLSVDLTVEANEVVYVVDVPAPVSSPVDVYAGVPGPPGPPGTIVAVGPTPPSNPAVNDLWVDTS